MCVKKISSCIADPASFAVPCEHDEPRVRPQVRRRQPLKRVPASQGCCRTRHRPSDSKKSTALFRPPTNERSLSHDHRRGIRFCMNSAALGVSTGRRSHVLTRLDLRGLVTASAASGHSSQLQQRCGSLQECARLHTPVRHCAVACALRASGFGWRHSRLTLQTCRSSSGGGCLQSPPLTAPSKLYRAMMIRPAILQLLSHTI